jgi:Galactose oxidase, central domain
MSRFGKPAIVAFILLAAPAVAFAASGASRLSGTWRKLPAAPIAVDDSLVSAWTGKQLVVYGRRGTSEVAASYDPAAGTWTKLATPEERAPAWMDHPIWTGKQLVVYGRRGTSEVAASYDPAAGTWTKLATPEERAPAWMDHPIWTGKELLLWSPFGSEAFNPTTKSWRRLRSSVPGGIIVWTGREAIGWGGGCCGDAWANGAAYNPRTDAFRKLPPGPLAPSQGPIGGWDGRELLLFVSGLTPDGKPYPARLARAAAYNPRTNRWRRLAPLPARGGTATWDGHELLVVSSGARGQSNYAYKPTTNRWRRLASLPAPRRGATAVWIGGRLLVWGGENLRGTAPVRDGVAYEPSTNRWTPLPRSPLRARDGATVAWTGRSLIVWGGTIGTPAGTSIPPKHLSDGAMFTPSPRQMAGGQTMCGG